MQKTEEEESENPQLLDLSEAYVKVDEIPFDFTRRRLSTVVKDKNGKTQMVTKGAIEEMLAVCTFAEYDGKVEKLTDELKREILETVDKLNDNGFRVLGIAQKSNPSPVGAFSAADECDMVLMGYLAFLDPPKESTAEAIEALRKHGVTTKILTGDNEKVTKTVCKQVGLKVRNMLLGADIDRMNDDELSRAIESTDVFAKLTPNQKARIVSLFRDNGHVVGYMGDGINDAAAMKAADIGISVDTAVDVAKDILYKLDPRLRSQKCYMYCSQDFVDKYNEDYKLTTGAIPYNTTFGQQSVEGSNGNLIFVPLYNKADSNFIHITPKSNMLVGVNQVGEEETVVVEKFSSFVLTLAATLFFGTQFESISKERLCVGKIQ